MSCPCPDRRRWAPALLLAALAVAGPVPATAAAPDEPSELRLRKVAGNLALTWLPPADPADSYQVRRCSLASLSLTTNTGACILEGLASEAATDTPPTGNFFYLVSGSFAGGEGSLGQSFDGTTAQPRVGAGCGTPLPSGPQVIVITLEEAIETCGSQVTVEFAAGATALVGASCTGIVSAFAPATVLRTGEVVHSCSDISATGATGPGEVTRLEFQQVDCPLPTGTFVLTRCRFTDCDTFATTSRTCTLEVR